MDSAIAASALRLSISAYAAASYDSFFSISKDFSRSLIFSASSLAALATVRAYSDRIFSFSSFSERI
jgi:hypothetical protein